MYKILELTCTRCAQVVNVRAEQFDSIPECEKCDAIMLVNSVTTIEKEKSKNVESNQENFT